MRRFVWADSKMLTLAVHSVRRLHNMRTLHALPAEKARAVAAETLGVWCSLAARLGVWAIKAELEDLCFAVLMPGTFLRLKSTLDSIWGGRSVTTVQTSRSDEELMGELMASVPAQDDGLTAEQQRTRALLSCVLPFDLLTPRQWDSGLRASAVMTGAPASAAAALEALMACQKALRDELRLSAVAPGLEVTVQGRLKSLWSTHMKMQRKSCGAREVYDARALRVVVEDTSTRDAFVETEACYSLLSAVHKLWKPVGGEYDNYIANPKRSGYQSLHTAVRAPDGAPLEVQVRTRAMHEDAEYGAAAHWLYKDAVAPSASPATSPSSSGVQQNNIMAAAAAVVEPLVKALATTDGGPAARAAAEFAVAASGRVRTQRKESKAAAVPAALASVSPSGRRDVGVGTPLLRVDEGRLNDAVVVSVDELDRRLLVAVQFAERWGAAAGRRASAAEYSALAEFVNSRGWQLPGQGDFRVALEEFGLCSDGRYHKIDAYGRKLDACVEILDLSAGPGVPAASSGWDTGLPAGLQSGSAGGLPRWPSDSARTDEEALNDKVRLLRSLLTWEADMRGVADESSESADEQPMPSAPGALDASEVMCIVWPLGRTLRLPSGSTAGDVAAKFTFTKEFVNVNNALVPSSTPLHDGDIVIISASD